MKNTGLYMVPSGTVSQPRANQCAWYLPSGVMAGPQVPPPARAGVVVPAARGHVADQHHLAVVEQDQGLDVLVDVDQVGAATAARPDRPGNPGVGQAALHGDAHVVGVPGRAQVLDLLERPDRLQGALAELAVHLARVVVQLGQAPLHLPHRRSVLAVHDHVPAGHVGRGRLPRRMRGAALPPPPFPPRRGSPPRLLPSRPRRSATAELPASFPLLCCAALQLRASRCMFAESRPDQVHRRESVFAAGELHKKSLFAFPDV